MEKEINKGKSQKWAITLFTIAVFMSGLDNGIISTALTTISDSFNVSPTWGAWAVTIYTLGIAISVPIIGKLSDRYGRKRLFLIEITIFGIGSLLVALSPNFVFLLISRFAQAIGGGGIFIIGSSHILATLPKDKQGKALGMLGGMHGLSAVIGPNLGAVILQLTGTWQWMFLINLPIVVFLIVFGIFNIHETKATQSQKLDVIGSLILGIGILSFMFGLTNVKSQQFLTSIMSGYVFPFLIIGILSLVLFIKYEHHVEKRGDDPIIAYSLLRERLFRITLFLGLISGGFLAGIIFMPAFVQQVLQVPVENAGYWLTPMAIASGIGAGLGGVFTDRIGAERTIMIAGGFGVIGFFLFPTLVNGWAIYLVASILAGIGLGILLGAPLNVLVGQSTRVGEQGTALGTLSLIRQIGLTLFPTVYAVFITGAFKNIVPAIEEKYRNIELNLQGFTEDRYGELIKQVKAINEPELQHEVLTTIANVLKDGYSEMYIMAGILALITFITGMYLYKKNR